jgi:cephalosporin hydroxylase
MINICTIISQILFRVRGDFSSKKSVPNPQCHEFEVNNWIISEFVLTKLAPLVGYCPYPLNEQMLMVAAVCRIKPTHIFEWGTNIGTSARIFHETCKAFDITTEIHSVDLPDSVDHIEHPRNMRGYLVRKIPSVRLHVGDGLDTSLRVAAQHIKDQRFRPLFFIDGDHGYSSVKRELEAIIEQVPSANILLHDTFYQTEDSRYNVGPHQAVADALQGRSDKFKVLSQNIGLPGMTLLWHPSELEMPV